MSIFDSRTTVMDTYTKNYLDGPTFLLLYGDEEYPLISISESLQFTDRVDRELWNGPEIQGTATYVRTDNDEDGWAHHVFRMQMTYMGRRMQATYKVGTGWAQAPSVQNVLEGLINEARLIEFDGVEDLGYEPEKARRVERAIEKQTARLRRFIPGL